MTETSIGISGYAYEEGDLDPLHDYLLPSRSIPVYATSHTSECNIRLTQS